MSVSALKKKKKDLEDIRTAQIAALTQATHTTTEQLVAVERDLSQRVSRHEKALENFTRLDLLERRAAYSLPTDTGRTVYLPQTARGHVPMLRPVLRRLFPARYPVEPWQDWPFGAIVVDKQAMWLRVDGPGLSVAEADVFIALLATTGGQTEYMVSLSVWELLAQMVRSRNANNAAQLFTQIERLGATYIKLYNDEGQQMGDKLPMLISSKNGDAEGGSKTIASKLDARFAALYADGRSNWTPMSHLMLSKLDGRAKFTRWLALVLSTYGAPHRSSVRDLQEYSGIETGRQSDFRRDLIVACKILESDEVGLLAPGRSKLQKNHGNWLLSIEKRQTSARFDHRLEMPALVIDACSLWLHSSPERD